MGNWIILYEQPMFKLTSAPRWSVWATRQYFSVSSRSLVRCVSVIWAPWIAASIETERIQVGFSPAFRARPVTVSYTHLDVYKRQVCTNPYACFNWDRFGLESQLQINYALMCIQPEVAAANGITRESMINEIIDFYKTYTEFELSQTQAEYMLDGLCPDGLSLIHKMCIRDSYQVGYF